MDTVRDEAMLISRDNLLVQGARVDWFLQELVGLANSSESMEFGITLNVQGSIVSGMVISGRRYFEMLGQLLRDNGAELLGDWAAGFRDIYPATDEQEEGDESGSAPGYLHLREARIFGAYDSVIPSNQGMLWRGRINAISGFSIGQLNRGSAGPDAQD